jgi:MFS family permease
MNNQRGAVGPIVAIGVFGVMLGITYPLFALLLQERGASSTVIGLNGAMTPLGMLLSAAFIPALVRRFGPWLVMMTAAGMSAVILAPLGVTESLFWWFTLRFALGSCAVAMFIVSETWISEIANATHRGRLLTAYTSVLAFGFTIGPTVLALTHNAKFVGLGVAVASPLLALWPLARARTRVPAMAATGSVPIGRLARGLSVLLVAVIAVSVFDAVTLQFIPLYGHWSGLSVKTAALALTVLITGQMTLQYPVGWLADRLGAKPALILSLSVGMVGAVFLPWAMHSGAWMWPILAIWGGVSFAGYPVVLALLGEALTGTTLLLGNTAFAIVWGIGGVLGPPYVGFAIDRIGPNGMPWSLALLWVAALIITGSAFVWSRFQKSPGRRLDAGLKPGRGIEFDHELREHSAQGARGQAQ